jgi:glycosyltransferase involved in cell wall biosynthesis
MRVRRECQALVEAGYSVSMICPRGEDKDNAETVPGVRVHAYPPPRPGSTALTFLWEFVYSWLAAAVLTARLSVTDPFDVVQACNPPDAYFALALPAKLAGKPFVFDHHDLSPELYAARFGRRDIIWSALRLLERATFLTADHVIATNETFRRVAVTRGAKSDDAVTVVRNGPLLEEVRPRPSRPELKMGRAFLCCWVGVMGNVDDGIDIALQAVRHVIRFLGRDDCHFSFIGDGDAFDDMQALSKEFGLEQFVTFTGWLSRGEVFAYLSTADLALQPDPKSERTDASTASKTMEYMAFGLPVVAFDVEETRRSAGDAASYATDNNPVELAELIVGLLDDPDRRTAMGIAGRQRVESELAWDHQKSKYLEIFERLLGSDGVDVAPTASA